MSEELPEPLNRSEACPQILRQRQVLQMNRHKPRAHITSSLPILQGIQPSTGLVLAAKEKAVNWKVYKQQRDNYAIVAQLDKQPEDYRVALFLYSIGSDAVKIYNSFDLSDENRRKLSEIMKEFDKYAIRGNQ